MRSFKRGMAAATTAALCLTSIPLGGLQLVSAADADRVIKLQPGLASTFHDTNEDGLGEFEGWGTSLCWWANRLGYSDKMTEEAARVFFSDEGLDMNIGRYNVGGGDLVGEPTKVPVKEGTNIEGFVHETISSTYPEAKLHGKMYHYTYDNWHQYFNKFNNYTTLAAKKYKENGKSCSFVKDILIRPSWAFFKVYILDRGFLDGKMGFILSVNHYFYTMIKYVKLYYLLKSNGKL